MDSFVNALAVLPNGDLIAGGSFTTTGGVAANRVARWDGSTWSPLGSGMDGSVRALAAFPNGDVAAGGDFPTAIPVTVNFVARWNGFSWTPLGSGMSSSVSALASLPTDDLVAGGFFTSAGEVPSAYWAHWTDTGIPWAAEDPASQSAGPGSTLTLSASCAAGFDFGGAVTFQWRRNGGNVANGPGGASEGGGTVSGASGSLTAANTSTTLTIAGPRPSDSGQYSVVFTNACGSGASLSATVAVAGGCTADLNGDDAVDGSDLGVLLNAWGTCAVPCVSDLNTDGVVDGSDLGILLGNWGACP
jgi:hypothetical protein